MSKSFRIDLPTHTLASAPADALPLLESVRKAMGMIPNLYGDLANSPAVLSTYLHGYQQFRRATSFTPAEQETVLLTISFANSCRYCMSAHSWLAATSSKVPAETLDALRTGSRVDDPRLGALSRFTGILIDKRGRASAEDASEFFSAGYTERDVLDVVLAIGVKTMSNYLGHLFETRVDDPFAAWAWSPACDGCVVA